VTRRPPDGGRGLDGVIERAPGYYNPATEILDGAAGSDGDLDDPERMPDGSPAAHDPEPAEMP
jgi:beta-lysine 5,6-aminomutase alpha subunit